MRAVALLLALVLLPLPASSTAPSATEPGPYAHSTVAYDLGTASVGAPSKLVRLHGEAYVPTDAPGPRPVVVLVHGSSPSTVVSYKGYAYIGTILASHGVVVLSMDVSPLDPFTEEGTWRRGRVEALNATLDRLATDPPRLPLARGASLDLSNVGIAGQSRGGLAVVDAGFYDAEAGSPRGVRAVLPIAPVGGGSVPLLPFLVLLPYCDGQTFDHGMETFERSIHASAVDGEKMQVVAMGANHNWYNSLWLNDDWIASDPVCGTIPTPNPAPNARLTPEDQRRHGLAVVASFFRTTLLGDGSQRAWLEARAPPPADACPAGSTSCPDRVRVAHEPDPDDRFLVERGDGGATNDAGGASTFSGFASTACGSPPSGTPDVRQCFAWSGPATWSLAFPAEDARNRTSLRFRAGNNGAEARGVEAALVDANGTAAWVALQPVALEPAPGINARKVYLHDVRVPLDAFAGVDLSSLTEVWLRFGADGPGSAAVAGVLLH